MSFHDPVVILRPCLASTRGIMRDMFNWSPGWVGQVAAFVTSSLAPGVRHRAGDQIRALAGWIAGLSRSHGTLARRAADLPQVDRPHDGQCRPMGSGMAAFAALEPCARMGQGFGLGFAVRTEQGRNLLPGSPNDYYWGGAYGTYFWHDPRERMYVVFMMQSRRRARTI